MTTLLLIAILCLPVVLFLVSKPVIYTQVIIVLAMLVGLASYLGLPGFLYQLALEGSLILLFILSIYKTSFIKKERYKAPFLIWFLLYTTVILLSMALNSRGYYDTYLMYRNTLLIYLFFLTVYNFNFKARSVFKINRLIIFLVILQIPAAIYKYTSYGLVEGTIIGTISTQAGTLSTIFPLFVIGYLFSLYMIYKRKPVYLFLIIGFVFFSWGGGKRAFWFVLPVLLLIGYMLWAKNEKRITINVPRIAFATAVLMIVGFGVLYTAGRMSPTLNPEGEVGGSFDIVHMYEYSRGYYIGDRRGDPFAGEYTTSRFATPVRIYEIISSGDTRQYLFGLGPDIIYGQTRDEIDHLGFRAGVTGLGFQLISVGVLGALFLFMFFLKMGMKYYEIYKFEEDIYWKALMFGGMLATFVFLFDFFFYSRAFISGYNPALLFVYGLAIGLNRINK